MSQKRKRAGSLLCFSAPETFDEKEENEKEDAKKVEKKHKSEKVEEPGEKAGGRRKGHHFRVLSKIISFFSIRSLSHSSKHHAKSRKDHNRSLARRTPKSSETQTANEITLDSLLFSSSALSSSSCSSSSSSSSSASSSSSPSPSLSQMSSNILVVAPEMEPKVKAKKTFMPPSVFKNIGYVRGLCLILLSLFVMVFCGRLFSILFTATWLCLVPRQRVGGKMVPVFDNVVAVEGRRRGESREMDKKRIVLKGFLQRDRKEV